MAASPTTPGGAASGSSVERARHSERPAVDEAVVDHRAPDVAVAEQRLNGANVDARLEEVRCKAVAERLASGWFVDSRRVRSGAHRILNRRFIEVMEHQPPAEGIVARPRRREVVLPPKLPGHPRVKDTCRFRKID